MLRYLFGLLLFLSFPLIGTAAPAREAVLVVVNDDIPADLEHFLNGRNPLDVKTFNTRGARRDIVEVTLLMQALHLGGFNKPVELRTETSYLRMLRGVADGRYVSSGAPSWKRDIDLFYGDIQASPSIVQNGEFLVGIYTTKRNLRTYSKLTPNELKQLKVVTNAQWKSDVHTLQELGFSNIVYSPNWVNMVRMLEAGRAEITLAPFQTTPQMSTTVGDVTLYPIQGTKVAISGSRHWAISLHHPDAKAFYAALEKGLKLLQSNGTIARAYKECGFFHPAVSSWTLLAR